MRAVVQRVRYATMYVDDKEYSKIKEGLLVYLGVHEDDEESDLDYIIRKVLGLRIFEDEDEKMNLSIKDVDGEIMIVSQFTLYGDARKGNRPSFSTSAKPDKAEKYYENFIKEIKDNINNVQTGVFGANMQIEYINDGPVTIQLDSSRLY